MGKFPPNNFSLVNNFKFMYKIMMNIKDISKQKI